MRLAVCRLGANRANPHPGHPPENSPLLSLLANMVVPFHRASFRTLSPDAGTTICFMDNCLFVDVHECEMTLPALPVSVVMGSSLQILSPGPML
jgi:hypothetical protein